MAESRWRDPLREIRCLAPRAISVPPEFERLKQLACNLWWSWSPDARLLFATIDSELWREFQNPLEVLRHCDESIWNSLRTSEEFQAKYAEVVDEAEPGEVPESEVIGALLEAFEADDRFDVLTGQTYGEVTLALNGRRAPLDDIRIRQAVSHATPAATIA